MVSHRASGRTSRSPLIILRDSRRSFATNRFAASVRQCGAAQRSNAPIFYALAACPNSNSAVRQLANAMPPTDEPSELALVNPAVCLCASGQLPNAASFGRSSQVYTPASMRHSGVGAEHKSVLPLPLAIAALFPPTGT